MLRTHLTTESFALSTWRNLASAHPIFKLLQPHIYGVLAIDTIGRKELIGSGGIVDQSLSLGGGGHVTFMEKCFKEVTIKLSTLLYEYRDLFIDLDVRNNRSELAIANRHQER